MKAREFLEALDHAKITAAVHAAERMTCGHIRVAVTHQPVEDAVAGAHREFARLEMEKIAGRNGVLIFLAPESRKFAVIGDQAIHERVCEDEFWQKIVDGTMRPQLKAGHFTAAIVAAVEAIGAELARHFPPAADGRQTDDDLPDAVEED